MVEDLRHLADRADAKGYFSGRDLLREVAERAEKEGILPSTFGTSQDTEPLARSDSVYTHNPEEVIVPEDITFEHERFQFNLTRRELTQGDILISMSPTEARILHLFTTNPNKIIPKPVISSTVWGSESVPNNITETYMGRLRRKLDELLEEDKFANPFATVYGKGYILLDKDKPGYKEMSRFRPQRHTY